MIYQLDCTVQKYAWGKLGQSSIIAQLLHPERNHTCNTTTNTTNTNTCGDDDDSTPYAELWMGTHTNGPSSVIIPTTDSCCDQQQQQQQKRVPLKEFIGNDLPFLFKILSVNQALSVQAHPNNQLAKQLHESDPSNYKDGNHKPELCCALTPFEAMCAFRPLSQISHFVQTIPELHALFSQDVLAEFQRDLDKIISQSDEKAKKDKLKLLFKAYMNADEDTVKEQLNNIVHRLSAKNKDQLSREESLLLRLHKDYAGDVGCFAVYFLNVLTLQPGEALFLAPNEPHSYIYGECVEVMACSDNVVRAGLTPKFRDVQTLCDMLTYSDNSLESYMNFGYGEQVNKAISIYKPPVPEFQLFRIQLSKSQQNNVTRTSFKSPTISILITIDAPQKPNQMATVIVKHDNKEKTVTIKRGDIYLVPVGAELDIVNESDEPLLMFVSSSNPDYKK